MKKKSSDYLSKGIIISLLLMVINLVGGFAHLQFVGWFKWTGTVVLLIALILLCIQYGKQKTDGVTFGNVFGYGFKISLVVSVLMVVYTLLSIYIIFPEFTDQAIQNARTVMEGKGTYSEDQIDQGVAMAKKFMQPIPLSIFAFLGTLFFGTIGALLGAAFTKKTEPDVFLDKP